MAQNLKHIAASQRRHYRIHAPLRIQMHEKIYPTADWSISGFRINGFDRKAQVGELLDIYVSVPFQGFDIGFPAQAMIVRQDAGGSVIGAEFRNLSERSQKTLETFIAGLTSGEMEAVDGVIRRLDVPVTPLSLARDNTLSPEEETLQRQKGMSLYIGAGIVLALVLMVVIYTNFFQLKIDTAVVMGTNDVINAPTAGRVTYIADLNKDIAAGMPLVSLSDPKLDYDISLARVNVQNASIQARQLDAVLQVQRERLVSATGIVSKQWEAQSHLVSSLQSDLTAKGAVVEKTRGLIAKGLETTDALQRAQADYMETDRELNQAKLAEVTLEQQLAAVKGGFQVHDQLVQAGMQDTQSLATAADEKLAIAKSQLDFLNQQKDALTIKAPAAGRLVRVFAPLGSTAKLGDPIAVFERGGKRIIQVFLTQQEALNIVKGETAKAYTPSSWWSIPVRVADIDYYSLTLHQSAGHFQWQNLLNAAFKTVVVTVEPIGNKDTKALDTIAPGTAATVIF